MGRTQQTFANDKDRPIYISVEIWPECFELQPGEKLTLRWNGPETGDVAQIDIINDDEIVVWPNGETDGMEFLIDGQPALERSWAFKRP